MGWGPWRDFLIEGEGPNAEAVLDVRMVLNGGTAPDTRGGPNEKAGRGSKLNIMVSLTVSLVQ